MAKKSARSGQDIFINEEEDAIVRRNGIEHTMTLMDITVELEAIDLRRADLLNAVRDLHDTYLSSD